MKVSLNWLQDHITWNKGVKEEEIIWRITEAAAEVEYVEHRGANLENCVIGKVEKLKKHPDADKLQLCEVSLGKEKVQIVCGGTNLSEGMLVAIAKPGAMVKWHGEGDPVKLEKAKIRGQESVGMICAADELELGDMFPSDEITHILDLTEGKYKVGQDLAQALELKDTVLHIDNHAITHRPDLFSHVGMAREFVALGLATWNNPKDIESGFSTTCPKEGTTELPLKVSSKEASAWSHYQAINAKNLSTQESPLWMRKRLAACGIRSINVIVDLTNYVMLEVGMPAHAFDISKLPGEDFTTRLSKKGEKVTTLDGTKREMPEGIIIIENGGNIVDLCGVMGGENSGIEEGTTDVFFHCVTYDPVRIRKAMISLGHRTDAGTIFEKGLHPELAEVGMNRLLELTMKVAPKAKIASKRFSQVTKKSEKRVITVSKEKITRIIGMDIADKDISNALQGLGFQVTKTAKDFKVEVPAWRMNGVHIAEDVIEEIIRIHGYSKVPTLLPEGSIEPPMIHRHKIVSSKIREVLSGQGFSEEQNFSFLGRDILKKFEWKDEGQLVAIKNPVSEDFKYLRPSLLPYLLSNTARNFRQNDMIAAYEIQKTFLKKGEDVVETLVCNGCMSGEKAVLSIKGAVEEVLASLGITPEFEENTTYPHAHPGRSLTVKIDGKEVGMLYEVKPAIRRNFELPEGTAVFELDIMKLVEHEGGVSEYKKLSKFPNVTLDVSVLVDQQTRAKSVRDSIIGAESTLLQKIDLKDIYEAKNLGEGKKSLTFAMTYQAEDRTLEDKEIKDILDKVIKTLEKDGGTVRR